jgi:hypothetical protein
MRTKPSAVRIGTPILNRQMGHATSSATSCLLPPGSLKVESIDGFPEAMERFLPFVMKKCKLLQSVQKVILQYYKNVEDVNCNVVCGSEKMEMI